MTNHAQREPEDRRLARLLGAESGAIGDWREDELAAVCRHQWSSPVVLELGGLPSEEAKRLRTEGAEAGLLLSSYADLFGHPRPPLGILRLVKDYAKAHILATDPSLPRPIGYALYYSAIFAALVRHGVWLSDLGPGLLRDAAVWLVGEPWAEPRARDLASAALLCLDAPRPTPPPSSSQPS